MKGWISLLPIVLWFLWWASEVAQHGWTFEGCVMANFMAYFAIKEINAARNRELNHHDEVLK